MHFSTTEVCEEVKNLGVTVNGDTVTIPNSYINGFYFSSYKKQSRVNNFQNATVKKLQHLHKVK